MEIQRYEDWSLDLHQRVAAQRVPVCEYCEGGSKYKDLMQVVVSLHQGKPIAASEELSANNHQEPAISGQGSPPRGA